MRSDQIPVSQDMFKEIAGLYNSEELKVFNLLSMFADGSITKWRFMHEIRSLKMVNFPWTILLYRNSLIENSPVFLVSRQACIFYPMKCIHRRIEESIFVSYICFPGMLGGYQYLPSWGHYFGIIL